MTRDEANDALDRYIRDVEIPRLKKEQRLKSIEHRLDRIERFLFGPNQAGTYKCLVGYAVAHKTPCRCAPSPFYPCSICKTLVCDDDCPTSERICYGCHAERSLEEAYNK